MTGFKLAAVVVGLLVMVAFGGCGGDGSSTTTEPSPHPLAFAREPDMGVACGHANSISSATACDRVGLAVWLKRPAQRVTASIAGRPLTLSKTGEFGDRLGYWEGFLHPAGLAHGALRLPGGGGDYWAGDPPVSARVRTTAYYADGSAASTRQRVVLRPGYG